MTLDHAFGAGRLVDVFILVASGTISSLVSAGRLRGGGTLLALQRILVLALAADAVALGHDLRGLDHGHPQRGLDLEQMLFGEMVEIDAAHLHQEMDSTPAPTTMSVPSVMICCAAQAMAFSPLEQ